MSRCLTDINRYLNDTENQFYKVLVISVKYQLSIGLHLLYWLNLVKHWFTQISTLVIFNDYSTDTNWYISETNIINKIG